MKQAPSPSMRRIRQRGEEDIIARRKQRLRHPGAVPLPLGDIDRANLTKSLGGKRLWLPPHRDVIDIRETTADLLIVTKGLAARYVHLRDGRRRILSFVCPGDACNLDLLFKSEMDHSVSTIVRTEVALIPWTNLRGAMEGNPAVAQIIWRSAAEESVVLRQALIANSQRGRAQVAHIIHQMYLILQKTRETYANSYVFPLTQEEMADATGLTAVHVNRMLKQLRDEGIIKFTGRRLTIRDPEGLMAESSFYPGLFEDAPSVSLAAHLGILPMPREDTAGKP
jgi:CRP-like cAMP-binding protein